MKKIALLIVFSFGSLVSIAQDCPDSCEYYLPNNLTADADCFDCNILKFVATCPIENFDFKLYNRWGEIIFESSDQKFEFDPDGTRDGTYVWKLKGTFCNNKELDDYGYLNILR